MSIIYFTLNLLLSNSPWDVRPVKFDLMKSTLTKWREGYSRTSFEYISSFEMIGWHATTTASKGCFGIYDNYELRALSQIYKENDQFFLRSIITPNHETTAGTVLIYKMLEFDDIKVDYNAIQKNSRWYIAALFIKNSTVKNSTEFFL